MRSWQFCEWVCQVASTPLHHVGEAQMSGRDETAPTWSRAIRRFKKGDY